MKRLVVATRNLNKVREVRSVLAPLQDWELREQPDTVPEIEETGATFTDNAILKAVHTSRFVDDFVLADDSGLCVDALDGRPGVFSNRYAAGDSERIQRVLREMESIPDPQRGAAFVCALALARHGEVVWSGEGRVEGSINRQPRGTNGFGYDLIFHIPELARTMAELTAEQKNEISHRDRALRELCKMLVTWLERS